MQTKSKASQFVCLSLVSLGHLVVSSLLTSASGQEPLVYGDLTFEGGKTSFVDILEWYDPLYGGGPAPDTPYAPNILGPANGYYAPLGRGGAVQLRFADNWLTNSGDAKPDLFFGESIGTPESAFMFLRPSPETAVLLPQALDEDLDLFYSIGEQIASKNLSPGSLGSIYGTIDLDALFPGFAAGALTFDGIRVVDNPDSGSQAGLTVGMDLESVGALSSIARSVIRGDFNFDGHLDDADLQLMKTLGQEWLYDLTGDGFNRVDDRDYWVREIMHSGPGDANFDGEFNSADLIQVFAAGEYEDKVIANSRWSTGDWNYSGDFTSRDLTLAEQAGTYETGPIVTPVAVPEPSAITFMMSLTGLGGIFLRQSNRHKLRGAAPHDDTFILSHTESLPSVNGAPLNKEDRQADKPRRVSVR